jgi:hypothetical protein
MSIPNSSPAKGRAPADPSCQLDNEAFGFGATVDGVAIAVTLAVA